MQKYSTNIFNMHLSIVMLLCPRKIVVMHPFYFILKLKEDFAVRWIQSCWVSHGVFDIAEMIDFKLLKRSELFVSYWWKCSCCSVQNHNFILLLVWGWKLCKFFICINGGNLSANCGADLLQQVLIQSLTQYLAASGRSGYAVGVVNLLVTALWTFENSFLCLWRRID